MTKSAEPLLENDAHEKFMKTTGHLWGYMCIRFKNQGHGLLPFGCNDLRSAALKAMGGKEDGFVQCPYCRASFTIGEVFF